MTNIMLYAAGFPSWVGMVVAIVVAAILILLFYKFNYRLMERRMTAMSRESNERLNLMLMAGHVNIWVYDATTRLLTSTLADSAEQEVMTIDEFSARYGREVFEQLREKAARILNGEQEEEMTDLSIVKQGKMCEYQIIIRPLRRDANGKPSALIITRNDTTEQYHRQRQSRQLLMQFQAIFDYAMVDMMYFDVNGTLMEINQNARETFHLSAADVQQRKLTIEDLLGLDRQHLKDYDCFYATLNIGQMYYELQTVPFHDSQGNVIGVYTIGRNVTMLVKAYQQRQEAINNLAAATAETELYVKNINYVLNVGGVRLVDYTPDTHAIIVYKGVGQIQLQLSPARYMPLISHQSMQAALRVLNRMDNKATTDLAVEVETVLSIGGRPLVLQFNFIPTYNHEGQVVSYLGMCRDVSELKTTEEELAQKTLKAQKMGAEKNEFLRNMSYEIRTPLNSVIGFAELFEKPHSNEDEAVYISQIRENSEFLLQLINDILFLSRLDARMTEIHKQPTDFSKTFAIHCQTAWKDHRHDGVNYIVENDFEQLVVNIDNNNVGHIINQVVQNAAIHTLTGFVRAHYDYVGNKLVIVVDDTGDGISKQTLSTIYERFSTSSKGTGLGLPICKELLAQMGGNIEISSTPRQGTTVWITLPCEATVIERKKNI